MNLTESEGMKYLGDALQQNTVRFDFHSRSHIHHVIQGLTKLILESNSITDEGVEYLTNGLQYNTVKFLSASKTIRLIFRH